MRRLECRRRRRGGWRRQCLGVRRRTRALVVSRRRRRCEAAWPSATCLALARGREPIGRCLLTAHQQVPLPTLVVRARSYRSCHVFPALAMLFDGAAQLDVLVGGPADVRQALLGTLAAHRLGLRGRRARGRRQARGAAGHVRVRRVVVVPTRCRGAGWMLLAHGLVGEHIQRRDRRSLVHVHAQYTPAFRTAEHRRRERQLVVTHTAVPRGRASRAHIGLMVVRAERLCRMQ